MIKTTLIIDGMMCGMCESHINDTIRQSFKIKKVASSHAKGTTEIISTSRLTKRPCVKRSAKRAIGFWR